MEKEFLLKLKLKGNDTEFFKDMGKGIIVVDKIKFDLSEEEYSTSMFIKNLLDFKEGFLNKYCEVVLEEI